MGSIQPRVLSSVSNPSPSGIIQSSQFKTGGVSNFVPLDGGPEKPEPLPSPRVSPTPTAKSTRSPSSRNPQFTGTIPFGANIHYQLGKQGSVGGNGGSYQLGSALTASNAAVNGRASGALTQGGWTQGAASGNYSGGPKGTASFVNNGNSGATASGLSGISSDRGRR